jgi:predicted ATPase
MNSLLKSEAFFEFAHYLENVDDKSSVGVVESYSINGGEKFLEIILNHVWIRTNGKNLQ